MKNKKVHPLKYYNDQRDLKKAQMGKTIKKFFQNLGNNIGNKKPDTSKPQPLKRNKCTSGSKRGCKGGLRNYQF